MRTLVTVSLSDFTFQIDEAGHAVLRDYLERASGRLQDNPDKDEILADLERAIGERCAALVTPVKTTVAAADITRVLEEIGPVEAAGGDASGAAAHADSGRADTVSPRRLYRIGEGAVLGGVCAGLAAYFRIDVVLVRVIFVGLTILTSGIGGIVVYLIMMFVVPYAPASVRRPWFGEPLGLIVAIVTGAILVVGIFNFILPLRLPIGLPELIILGFVLAVVIGVIAIVRSRRSAESER